VSNAPLIVRSFRPTHVPRIAETPAASGSPVPLLDLGRALRQQRIACCQWKGFDRPEWWATGRGEVALLVDRVAAARFDALAARHGFRRVVPPFGRTLPGIAEYLGTDPVTGVLLCLHVHYRLVVGRHDTARYRLPVEQPVLAEAVRARPFPIPSPEWALILFVLRTVLRTPQPRLLPATWSGTAEALEADVVFSRLEAALEQHLPAVPYPCFEGCLRALIERDDERWHREAARLRERLAPLREGPPIAALAAAAATRLGRLLGHRSSLARAGNGRARGGRRLASGGVIVALVGGAGAGKSKAAAALETWLAPELSVLRIHAGRPPRSLATLATGAALELVRRFLGPHAERSAILQRLYTLHSRCTALDRLRLCAKASRFAARGGIVIAEQYPLRQDTSLMDPTNAALAAASPQWPLVRLLPRAEEDLDARIPPPDAVVLLRVTPEVAAARKVGADTNDARECDPLLADADSNGARVVDADRPFAEMLHELREVVWQAL